MENEMAHRTNVDTADIQALIKQLGHRDIATREQAYNSLRQIGEEAVKDLTAALSNPSGIVRWEAAKLLDEIGFEWVSHADEKTVKSLVNDLGSKNALVRVRARKALVSIGPKAINFLAEAFRTSKVRVCRWEAMKALSQIADPSTVMVFIKALRDESFEIRWLASEGLVAAGNSSLIPLLRELASQTDSLWLREGAHRTLHGIRITKGYEEIKPVLTALEDVQAPLRVPFVAKAVLERLEGQSW
jgi:HEAT repeat protein